MSWLHMVLNSCAYRKGGITQAAGFHAFKDFGPDSGDASCTDGEHYIAWLNIVEKMVFDVFDIFYHFNLATVCNRHVVKNYLAGNSGNRLFRCCIDVGDKKFVAVIEAATEFLRQEKGS